AAAVRGLLNTVLAQLVALLIATLITLLVSTSWAALSIIAGGMTYLIPTALFVLHLVLRLLSQKPATATMFLVGEAIKIGVAMILMVLVIKVFGTNLVWPAFFVGLLVVLKAYVLLLVFKKL
ncbi:ATP synthase subunit I, partial [Salmonella enterica subsp. enterica serovar Brandenburg]|nr:ATP synthase subunit I [Salmonella enterica subsp. enterica serovar Brandenburg]